MIVIVNLLTAGVDTGPFNLYSNADGFVTPIAYNVSKTVLTAGYTLSSVPLGTTLIRAKSLGICGNVYTVGISTGYIGLPTTTSTTTTAYIGPLTTTSTSTSTSSTSTSSTSSSTTTSNVPRPTFTLVAVQIPGSGFITIDNVVNGTRFNYNIGSTYTASNTCLNPMGLIDPDVGASSFYVPGSTPYGTLYTVRVYNGANCSAYTDHTIPFGPFGS